MQEINRTDNKITKEQNTKFEEVYSSISINISIGNNTISIPNNADNIETIVAAIKECFEQTLL